MSRLTAVGTAVLVLLAGAVLASPAAAEERSCAGTIAGASLDNVRVPQGATCVLRDSVLNGTLKVERNATLRASNLRINGNVQGEGARLVEVEGSRIGGAYQVVQGQAATLLTTAVKGTILVDSNAGAIRLERNIADDNIQAFQNRGGVSILQNSVEGNLQCKANNPAPTGGGNVVQGVKEDQCARL